ncbi:class I SAM-dependent methyltransferase [Nocardiopsis flavescens]|uniref:class I SAM-dependent methyltransferase n=1 Tax=Nocardiopsis flavescens TaxID=758803 RepID=UPI00365752EE
MPTSDPELKQWAVRHYQRLRPAVTVDIGTGEGTYARLMRPHHHGTWVGVEAWAPYVGEFGLRDLYDRVVIADVRHLDLHTVHHGPDLVIAGDVLEHMAADEARVVIAKLKAWADHLLVSIPIVHYPQGPYQGNWFDAHQDHWSHQGMLDLLSPGVVDAVCGRVLGYFLWSAHSVEDGSR